MPPHHGEGLNRYFADWQRFAAHHRNGGHMVFANRHVKHHESIDAATNSVVGREDGAGGDMNKRNLAWGPLGPACSPFSRGAGEGRRESVRCRPA